MANEDTKIKLDCIWADCERFCVILERANVPLDNKWPHLILHLRGLKDDEFLSNAQKENLHRLLLSLLEKKDFSDKSYRNISQGVYETIVAPCEAKLVAITKEAIDLTKEVDKILGRQKNTVLSVAKNIDDDLAQGKEPLQVIAELREGLKSIVNKIEQDSQELKALAMVDPLTGLANRRAFDIFFDEIIAQWEETKIPVALVMCDLDHFKDLNDNYGHAVGDQVLRTVSQQLKKGETQIKSKGIQCLVARYGGEEFALILTGQAALDSRELAEDIRSKLETFSLRLRDGNGKVVVQGLKVTMSLGVAELNPDWKGAYKLNLIEYADKALYYAKSQGRNRIGIYVPDAKDILQIYKPEK